MVLKSNGVQFNGLLLFSKSQSCSTEHNVVLVFVTEAAHEISASVPGPVPRLAARRRVTAASRLVQ